MTQVTETLKADMSKLNFAELKVLAETMGVKTRGLNRAEIEDECLALEQYAFTH
jgi:hypothetical protein